MLAAGHQLAKDTSQLNLDFNSFPLPLTWNNSVINLVLVWSTFFFLRQRSIFTFSLFFKYGIVFIMHTHIFMYVCMYICMSDNENRAKIKYENKSAEILTPRNNPHEHWVNTIPNILLSIHAEYKHR